jgi:NAD(P)-dependent dehydrogenase (short-subunit alcohol dehydrogenase family)
MSRTAVVTGAGSGVGRAVALQLVREGWNVGLVGRRESALKETIGLAAQSSAKMVAAPCDVGDPAQVEQAAKLIEEKFGAPAVLVAAAGLNIPKRAWEVLTYEDFRHVIDANLAGTFNWVRQVLPSMRKAQNGTIVAIVSDAALNAMPKAGAAYTASKFAQRGLVQSINAEERQHGIRATAILPGDINTPILDKRPVPPPPEARAKMLQADDVAACVMLAVNLPGRAIVEELLLRPR